MQSTFELLITEPEHQVIRAHYQTAGPLIDHNFHGTPLVTVSFPKGLGHDSIYHKSLDHAPPKIATIAVNTVSGERQYVQLDLHNMTWLVAGRYAVEFHSWAPIAGDPERAAFARLILSPAGTANDADVAAAAHRVLAALNEVHNLQAIPIINGKGGIALWIPFDDAPHYDVLRAWLSTFAKHTAAAHPDQLTVEWFVKDRGNRVYLGTHTNEPGGLSILPYSLRGTPSLEVAIPCPIEELKERRSGDVTAATFEAYAVDHGDEFANLRQAIPEQNFAALKPTLMAGHRRRTYALDLALAPHDARGYIISAALAVLADGKPRNATAIVDEATARGLVAKSMSRKILLHRAP